VDGPAAALGAELAAQVTVCEGAQQAVRRVHHQHTPAARAPSP